ncbi:M42 family metallopeptidase [Clostridium saudiense]|uniref:M42 family metallopeptidase n=1 Tax=Clostridium saudiense TaxID=1414720 RepID=UPI00311AB267
MINLSILEELSNSFGPSGFEDDVTKIIQKHCREMDVNIDAMNNVYVELKNNNKKRPVIMLDAHTDEVGFMVQAINENGLLSIVQLGGWHITNIPAHTVYIKNRDGKLIKGITTSKPVHFMTASERANNTLEIEDIYVDVGATSKDEVVNTFNIRVGDPIAPKVEFDYNKELEVCYGKAFDNRVGCFCIIETLKLLSREKDLGFDIIGAFAAQEEVGTRGAQITSQVVKPDLAIVFEGSPADDLYYSKGIAQSVLKNGTQIRNLDQGYIGNHKFIRYVEDIAEEKHIKFQNAVRRGGSTNAAKISLFNKAVPVLVLGIPSRYVHSHYNFCAKADIEATVKLAYEIIVSLKDNINKIL